jgi:hypothetical protein
MPIKEGEHAYVIFEDNSNRTHGLWLTRIPESKKIDKLNLVPGEKKYEENKDNNYSDKAAQGSALDVKQPKQSDDFAKEDVPDFTARVGDRVIHGSNNTLILLSRDRKDKPDSGEKKEAGSIFLIAGRKKKEEINIQKDGDDSVILISMKSEVDANFGIKDAKAGKDAKADASIVVRSNEIRISARKGMKIIVDKGDLYIKADGKVNVESSDDITVKTDKKVDIKADKVNVGGEDGPGVLGDKLQQLWTKLTTELTKWSSTVMYNTAMGPTIGPGVPPLQPPGWESSINSNSVKIKK